MDTQAPDLALHFHAGTMNGTERSKNDEGVVVDEAELEQLADRVNAARSVY